jgi:hypothetical protein
MNSFKTRALLGASALALASSIGASAHAGTILGGGSTLLAPYWAQGAFCYDSHDAANQTFLTPTGSTTRPRAARTTPAP